jgi:hypothetical protein
MHSPPSHHYIYESKWALLLRHHNAAGIKTKRTNLPNMNKVVLLGTSTKFIGVMAIRRPAPAQHRFKPNTGLVPKLPLIIQPLTKLKKFFLEQLIFANLVKNFLRLSQNTDVRYVYT